MYTYIRCENNSIHLNTEISGTTTFVCIAHSSKGLRVSSHMATKAYDIVSVDWLIRAMQSDTKLDRLLPFHPSDMMYATDKLKKQFAEDFDQYGDSYTKPVTENELFRLMEKIDSKVY